MVSNFYGSTQSRLKTYTADRRVEERNGDIQQAKVYKKLAEEQGDMETADRLAKLGMNIIGKIGATEVPIVNKQGGVAKMSVKEHIMSMIEAGTLSNWWEAIKKIPPKNLSPKARIIQKDIKHNEMLKSMINDKLRVIQEMKYPGVIPVAKREAIIRELSSIQGFNIEDVNNAEKLKSLLLKDLLQTFSGGDEAIVQELDAAVSVAATSGGYHQFTESVEEKKSRGGSRPKSLQDRYDTITSALDALESARQKNISSEFEKASLALKKVVEAALKSKEGKNIFKESALKQRVFKSGQFPRSQATYKNIEQIK